MNERDWTAKTLSQIADITMGQSPDSKYYNQERTGLPFLQGCAEFGKNHPKPVVFCEKPNKIAKQNSILFSVRAPVGKMNIADQDYCIGRGLAGINAKTVDPDLLFWLLDLFKSNLAGSTQGSTFDSVNSRELNNLKINVPISFDEQRTISTILSQINSIINQTENLIAKYQRIKTGLMQDLLTKGIDEKGNIRSEKTHEFKDSELGRIPKEWDAKELGELFNEFQTGATPRRDNPAYWSNGNVLWVTSGELKYKRVDDTIEKITEQAVRETNLKKYKPGTFFIAITGLEAEGTRGSCAIIGKEATTNQSCMAFVSNDKIDVRYLYQYYLLWGKYISIKFAQGTKQQSLNGYIVSKIPIILPIEKNEQVRIAEKLEMFDQFIEQQSHHLEKLNSLKNGLMQDLLNGKVSIPEELIKRINSN